MKTKHLFRIALLIAISVGLSGCLNIPETDSDTRGGITWTYALKTRTLTFTGSGQIPIHDKGYTLAYYNTYSSSTEYIILNEGISKLGASALAFFVYIFEIDIPNSVTDIGYRAFYACYNLESVTIGSGCKKIEDEAFGDCYEITSVTCNAVTPPDLSATAFYCFTSTSEMYHAHEEENHIEKIDLFVPAESVNAYKNNTNWKKFKSISAIQ